MNNLSLEDQAKMLLKNPNNLDLLLSHLFEYGRCDDESLDLNELNIDCFMSKDEYSKLKKLSSEEELEEDVEEGYYTEFVSEKYAILEPENWDTLLDIVRKMVRKIVHKEIFGR